MNINNDVDGLKVSNYEEVRRQKMLENQKLLEELGLAKDMGPTSALLMDLPPPPKNFPATKRPAPKYNGSKANKKIALMTTGRSSRRLKGEAPDDTIDLNDFLDQQDQARQSISKEKLERLREIQQQEDYMPMNIEGPFTLASIGTTIWDIGKIYTGEHRRKYWSRTGCKYFHPYPIGYRATKSHFGNQYTMTITEGEEGPLFSVQVNSSEVFTGLTPTAPWTTACLRSKSQGTRVSGPLFFGFSDLITVRLIEGLEDYDKADDPKDSGSSSTRASSRLQQKSSD